MRIFLIAALVMSVSPVFGQEISHLFGGNPPTVDFGDQVTDAEVLVLVNALENKTWDSQTPSLTDIAKKIPINAKYALYERYKVAGAWGLLNIYGVGGFIQGDPSTSLVAIAGMGTAIGTAVAGGRFTGPERNLWVATGVTVGFAAFAYAMVRPWFFADEKNEKLRKALFPS